MGLLAGNKGDNFYKIISHTPSFFEIDWFSLLHFGLTLCFGGFINFTKGVDFTFVLKIFICYFFFLTFRGGYVILLHYF